MPVAAGVPVAASQTAQASGVAALRMSKHDLQYRPTKNADTGDIPAALRQTNLADGVAAPHMRLAKQTY